MLRVIADTFSVVCRYWPDVDILLHYLYTKDSTALYMSAYVKLVHEASGCDLLAFDVFYSSLLSATVARQTGLCIFPTHLSEDFYHCMSSATSKSSHQRAPGLVILKAMDALVMVARAWITF